MRKFLVAAVAVSTLAFAASAQASITVYTNEADFLAAAGLVVTEDFNDSTLISGLSFISDAGSIGSGLFNDRVVLGYDTTTFSFASSTAFGGTFDESYQGFGQGLRFFIDGSTLVGQLDESEGSFYGFVSTSAFTSVLITAGLARGNAETYSLDNLTLGVAAVPEPATWGLMLVGFGGLGAVLRRAKAKAAFAAA